MIQKNRGIFLFESVVFILMGVTAIAVPSLFTYSIELLIGGLLLVGGIVQSYRCIKAGMLTKNIGAVISALASLLLGLLLLLYPITGIIALTLLIALFFFIEGIAQLYVGFSLRELRGSSWLLFSGIISLLLAALIWSGLPGSAAWVIGLLLGINLLFFGFSQLFLVLATPKE